MLGQSPREASFYGGMACRQDIDDLRGFVGGMVGGKNDHICDVM